MMNKTNSGTYRILARDVASDVIGSILYSIGVYMFAKNADFTIGGISGLSLIANHLWKLPIGATTLIMNIPLIFLSWRIVGREFILKTGRTILIMTIFLDLIFPRLPAYQGSPLLSALYSGIFMGAGMAFFYMRGSSSGGTDLLTMSLKARYPHLSFGRITMVIDVIVIGLGWPVFRQAVLYGLICSFATAFVMDKILYGMGSGKLVLIITEERERISERILSDIDRGLTILNATGAYTSKNRFVLMCACSRAEAQQVIQIAREEDPDVFTVVTEMSEVVGNGFRERSTAV